MFDQIFLERDFQFNQSISTSKYSIKPLQYIEVLKRIYFYVNIVNRVSALSSGLHRQGKQYGETLVE